MLVATKGKGAEIKWVDIQDLPVTKELVKFKKESNEVIEKLKNDLGASELQRKKLSERIKMLEKYVITKEGENDEEDII